MELTRLAGRRLISTHPKATVLSACELMKKEVVGAMVVLDDGKLAGILSERDIVTRVVVARRDAQTTLVSDVMTTNVRTVTEQASVSRALDLMRQGGFRHLPLVDAQGGVIGMVSMRDLMRHEIEELDMKNSDLMGYLAVDGPGG